MQSVYYYYTYKLFVYVHKLFTYPPADPNKYDSIVECYLSPNRLSLITKPNLTIRLNQRFLFILRSSPSVHWGTYPRPCLSEILSISASTRSLWQALSPCGTEQTPPPHFSLLQHFWGPGHSKSCWQELPQIAGSSNGHVPGLFRLMLDGQQTPYSCFGSTRQLYIGGQVGFPGESPQRNGLGESVICSGSPAGQIVDSDFALRQLGIGGHGGRAHVTSINSHVWLVPGQATPRQGSRHSHLAQPVFGSICEWK